VAVGAGDTLTILAVAGALGGGAAGVGAGADVEVLNDNTAAFIGAADVRAAGAVDVNALSVQSITSDAIAVGAGVFALGGGISVLSIGGGLNAYYSADGEAGSPGSGNALTGGGGSSVTSSVDATLDQPVGLITQSGTGGLPAINPATAVDNVDHTINFGTADNL
jgi:hypothetical protein